MTTDTYDHRYDNGVPAWQLQRWPWLSPDGNRVPRGMKPRPGVEYGCGDASCISCYAPDPAPQTEDNADAAA